MNKINNHMSVLSSYIFRPKLRTMISLHWIPMLKGVLTRSVLLRDLWNVPPSRSQSLKHQFLLFSRCAARNSATQAMQAIILIRCWYYETPKTWWDFLNSRSLATCNIIEAFDFSTFYTKIPHALLRSWLKDLIHGYFLNKKGQRRFKCIFVGRNKPYFAKRNTQIGIPLGTCCSSPLIHWSSSQIK